MKNAKTQHTSRQTLNSPALFTDYYELTMAQGYYLSGRQNETAVFDYFFRDVPFDGGYVVFAGISDLLEILSNFSFKQDELEYLADQGFHSEFLEYLEDFELNITLHAAKEGEIVFPLEPVARIEGTIIEAQILETLLLNVLNFESLIATKASRMKLAAGDRIILDFGLRRAQGLGGIQASKAAVIGGVQATSNVYSAHRHGLPASGTMAHSWVQSYETELESFREFAKYYPENCVLLVDTYDTLESGIPNAIKVAKEMEERGEQLKGIRLDSGDLAYFARKSRQLLDEAGLDYVKIAASNQLDERLIKSLINQKAPIDLFGIGTRLVTGQDSPALDGVYKLSMADGKPKLKISENVEKITLPGKKKVYRYLFKDNTFYGDGILLEDEDDIKNIYHPYFTAKHSTVEDFQKEPLLHKMVENGTLISQQPDVHESAEYAQKRLQQLNPEHKRFDNPHIYKVGISKKLLDLREKLTTKLQTKNK
ncbi:MAG: nicotinate phosphoribosyltransferase [Balneolaceae bacterium]|nr:nicotinate phosphoribosyltransferase [Balneolaceae bacterium]